MMKREELKRELLRILQYEFPVSIEPWREIGKRLGIGENEVIGLIDELKNDGTIRRIGALLNKEKLGYKSLLIALKIEGNYESVVEYINSQIGVTHNYLRDDEWNIWFTFSYREEEELKKLVTGLKEFPEVVDLMLLPSEEMIKIDARF